MSFTKNEWGDLPPFKKYLRESFQSSFAPRVSIIYVSLPFLIEILRHVRAGGRDEFHYTHGLFSEVNIRRRTQTKDYLPVKVTDYVLMQKDVDLRIAEEGQSYKPYRKILSDLRNTAVKMAEGRSYACHDQLAYSARDEGLEPDLLFYPGDYTL